MVLIWPVLGWDGSQGVMGEQGCGTRVREMNGTAVVSISGLETEVGSQGVMIVLIAS